MPVEQKDIGPVGCVLGLVGAASLAVTLTYTLTSAGGEIFYAVFPEEKPVPSQDMRLKTGIDCMIEQAYSEGLRKQEEQSPGSTRFGYDPPKVHFEHGAVFSAHDFRNLVDGNYRTLGIEKCMQEKGL